MNTPPTNLKSVFSQIAWSLKQEGLTDAEIASAMLDTAVNLAINSSNHSESAKWLRTIADVVESRATPSN